jgi:hypothetical protein
MDQSAGIWQPVWRLGRLRAHWAPGLATVRKPPLADAVEVALVPGNAQGPPCCRCSQRQGLTAFEEESDAARAVEPLVAEHCLHLMPGDAAPPKATNVRGLWRQIDPESPDQERLGNQYAEHDELRGPELICYSVEGGEARNPAPGP